MKNMIIPLIWANVICGIAGLFYFMFTLNISVFLTGCINLLFALILASMKDAP